MSTTRVYLAVDLEVKEGHEGTPLPTPAQVAATAQDHLADITKHEAEYSWRALRVRPVRAVTR
jgi:hypothetical protein